MARKQKSSSAPTETRVQAAIRDYRSGKFKNIKDAATAHEITYGRLRNCLASKGPKGEAHVDQQLLTPIEEKEIVKWILRLDDWGFPPRMKNVKDMATHFVRSHGVKNPGLGANWTIRFITRHPELESKFAVRLDKQRGFANNSQVIRDFFHKLLAVVKTHQIIPDDTYNMDEKGFLMGKSAAVKVICKKGKKRSFERQDGLRELITVLETVSAAGRVLPPMIVYKGVAQYQGWHALVKEGDKAFFSYSSTGWTNRDIGLGYLIQNFDASTKDLAAGRTRLLIMDGHTSHVALEFFDYCLNNKIIPLCLPAHSTHLLQPLDVGLFGPLQRNYSTILDDWLESHGYGIHKGTFYPLLVKARERTYTVNNIKSAFEATGIYPYNPRRVLNSSKLSAETAKACPASLTSPRTPTNGKSVLSHTRRTMALFRNTPSINRKVMVEKLAKAAAVESAENVILRAEIVKLREKASSTKELAKVRNKKILTKALVVSADLVVQLRKEYEEKERLLEAKKQRAVERKKTKEYDLDSATDALEVLTVGENSLAAVRSSRVLRKRT